MEKKYNRLLEKLKWEFYDWCSTLSLDEVVSNTVLIANVEQVERLLISKLSEAQK